MKASHSLVLVFVLAVFYPPRLQARWEGKQDNKSITELEQMSNDQLFDEAMDACVHHALLKDTDSSDYLRSIDEVVRTRNQGKAPPWMTQLATAQTGKDCQRGFHAFHLQATVPSPQKKTAIPHRRRASRLPPWLAPPRE